MQRLYYSKLYASLCGLSKNITEWASQHHERIDGNGYPFQMGNGAISLEARIVWVADVFQALAQTRPYREALDANAICTYYANRYSVDI